MRYNTRDLRQMLTEIDGRAKGLSGWEIEFIASLLDNPPDRFSVQQAKKIAEIWQTKIGEEERGENLTNRREESDDDTFEEEFL